MENTHGPNREIDPLDFLVIIAENIKLLVLYPVVAGLLVLGVSFAWPQRFQSQAVIQADFAVTYKDYEANVRPELFVSMAHTSAVLEPVRQQLGFMPNASTEHALSELRESIKADISRAGKLVTITVTAPSAEQAQRSNQVLLVELFKQFKPRGADLVRLNAKLQFEKQALTNALSLEKELVDVIKTGKESDLLRAAYIKVSDMKGDHFDAIQSLEMQLLGLSENALVQPATLPEKPLSNKKAQSAIIAALLTGFVLLLFVFIRKALLNASAKPESAAKLASIRRSIGLS